ncbi:MAG: formate dehydrogenase accessory sulfurtransferase FdhD [Pseudomonadota bacterium]
METEHQLANEAPVAIVLNGTTVAVMMASPQDLGDFGLGFALSEGFIQSRDDVETQDVIAHAAGIEVRLWVAEDRAKAVAERRRAMLGPIGCGLCGIESLEQAIRDIPHVAATTTFSIAEVSSATDALRAYQPLHDQTRAIHAAGLLKPGDGIVCAREDVGRHNALDKLIGAMMQDQTNCADGAIVLTSRISVELVQKAAIAGYGMIISVSAPSLLSVETAEAANITLVALCNEQQASILTHPSRISDI